MGPSLLNFSHLADRELGGCSAHLLPLGTEGRLAFELHEDHGAGFAALTRPRAGAWPWIPSIALSLARCFSGRRHPWNTHALLEMVS